MASYKIISKTKREHDKKNYKTDIIQKFSNVLISTHLSPQETILQKPKITNSKNRSNSLMNVAIRKIKTEVKMAHVEKNLLKIGIIQTLFSQSVL